MIYVKGTCALTVSALENSNYFPLFVGDLGAANGAGGNSQH